MSCHLLTFFFPTSAEKKLLKNLRSFQFGDSNPLIFQITSLGLYSSQTAHRVPLSAPASPPVWYSASPLPQRLPAQFSQSMKLAFVVLQVEGAR
jgi:hypothetical protein